MIITAPVVMLIAGTWLGGNAYEGHHHKNPHPDTVTNVHFSDDPGYFCLEGEAGCGSDTTPCDASLAG